MFFDESPHPRVIAEMSGNHNGQLDRALAIVDAVAEAGGHMLKLQTYTADTMTIRADRPEFRVHSNQGLWGGRSLHDLYAKAHTPWDWHEPIFERARTLGLVPFSSPFDPTSIAFLETLNVALYKIASAEIIDLPLIREVARTEKPIIMSTGMASLGEIDSAVEAARGAGAVDITLLACTAAYPAVPEEARLANIGALRDAFGLPVGISDHTKGVGVSVAAAALGAVVIEKHVTLAREDGGVDAAFSLEPTELAVLVKAAQQAAVAAGGAPCFGPTPQELPVLELRRSLWVVEDVAAGDTVTAANVRSIRPGGGLPPDAFRMVEGRRFARAVERGTPFTWDLT